MRVQADRLTALVDGKVVIESQDDQITEAGNWGVYANDSWFESVEVQALPPAISDRAAAEPWQDVLSDPEKLVLSGAAERVAEGLGLNGNCRAMVRTGNASQRDGAVRLRAVSGGLRPELRARMTATGGSYQLMAAGKVIVLQRLHNDASQNATLRSFTLPEPLPPGHDYEMELRVVGQTLTAKFNGEILGVITDGTWQTGESGVAVSDRRDGTPTLVKSLEVLDLDAPTGASAVPGGTPP